MWQCDNNYLKQYQSSNTTFNQMMKRDGLYVAKTKIVIFHVKICQEVFSSFYWCCFWYQEGWKKTGDVQCRLWAKTDAVISHVKISTAKTWLQLFVHVRQVPPHQWFCPQRHISPEWALKKPGDTSDQIYLRQVVSLSLIPVLEIMTFAIGLLPRRQCSFLQMLITTMFFIIGAVIVSCSLKWLYIITQYYDQIYTIIIHAKSGWYLWYITAIFFGFSAKF